MKHVFTLIVLAFLSSAVFGQSSEKAQTTPAKAVYTKKTDVQHVKRSEQSKQVVLERASKAKRSTDLKVAATEKKAVRTNSSVKTAEKQD